MLTGFFYGQIVRIRVARHGKEKLRPVVVVTPNEAMAEGAPLVGVAITGTPDPPTGVGEGWIEGRWKQRDPRADRVSLRT